MTNKSPDWLPSWFKDGVAPLLAIIVVVGGLVVIYLKPEGLSQVIGTWVTMVLSYYFGSSRSSQAKNETISTALEKKEK